MLETEENSKAAGISAWNTTTSQIPGHSEGQGLAKPSVPWAPRGPARCWPPPTCLPLAARPGHPCQVLLAWLLLAASCSGLRQAGLGPRVDGVPLPEALTLLLWLLSSVTSLGMNRCVLKTWRQYTPGGLFKNRSDSIVRGRTPTIEDSVIRPYTCVCYLPLWIHLHFPESEAGFHEIKFVQLVWKVNVKVAQSCPTLYDPMDCPWNSLGQNTGVGSLSRLLQSF